jgi:plastocyanin
MTRITIFGLIAVFAAVGCGGSSNSNSSSGTGAAATPSGGGGQQLALTADASQLKYDTTQLTATAGKITITMANNSPLQHDVALKGGVDVKGDVVGQGGKSVVSADLKPGQYTFYCTVDGHEAAGMNGNLIVK